MAAHGSLAEGILLPGECQHLGDASLYSHGYGFCFGNPSNENPQGAEIQPGKCIKIRIDNEIPVL